MKLEPVELQLFAGLMGDLGGDRLAGAAAIAARAQLEAAQLADQGRVGAIEAEAPKLAVKDRREDVRVV